MSGFGSSPRGTGPWGSAEAAPPVVGGAIQNVRNPDLHRVRVTFTAGVGSGALVPATYTFIGQSLPSYNPVVTAARYINGKGIIANSLVELTLDNDLSPGIVYELDISAFLGTPASTAQFTAFTPNWPAARSFDLWDTIPTINKAEDTLGDLQRFIVCIQDQLDTTLASIDNWVDILDPDRAREEYLDAMLADLGNPFSFESLSENDKKLLVRVLVKIYQLKGTDEGIKAAIRFFLGFESQISLFRQSGSLLSSTTVFFDLLNDSFVLGGGGPYDFALTVATTDPAGRALIASEISRIEQIVNVVKPAGTRFVKPVFYGLPAPDRVQIAGSSSSVTITWSPTTATPDFWRVYYRLNGGNVTPFNSARYTQVAGGLSLATISTPVGSDLAGSTYYFVLIPFYNSVTGFRSQVEVRNNLSAPSSVIAVGAPQSVTVTWASINEATSYRVYKTLATTNSTSTPVIADFVFDVLGGATTFTDTGLLPGTVVHYCVVARTGDSEGYYSISVTGTAS